MTRASGRQRACGPRPIHPARIGLVALSLLPGAPPRAPPAGSLLARAAPRAVVRQADLSQCASPATFLYEDVRMLGEMPGNGAACFVLNPGWCLGPASLLTSLQANWFADQLR